MILEHQYNIITLWWKRYNFVMITLSWDQDNQIL
jgi:hypothetical protein